MLRWFVATSRVAMALAVFATAWALIVLVLLIGLALGDPELPEAVSFLGVLVLLGVSGWRVARWSSPVGSSAQAKSADLRRPRGLPHVAWLTLPPAVLPFACRFDDGWWPLTARGEESVLHTALLSAELAGLSLLTFVAVGRITGRLGHNGFIVAHAYRSRRSIASFRALPALAATGLGLFLVQVGRQTDTLPDSAAGSTALAVVVGGTSLWTLLAVWGKPQALLPQLVRVAGPRRLSDRLPRPPYAAAERDSSGPPTGKASVGRRPPASRT